MNRTEANAKAHEMLKGKSMNDLLILWAMTTNCKDRNVFTVRGWLMAEFNRRNPEGFNAWVDSLSDDDALKDYMI